MKITIDSILIPTDFSDLSESSLRVGIAIAKRQNASVTLLHVVDKFSYSPPNETHSSEFRITPDILFTVGEKLKGITEKIQKETGIKISGRILEGKPSDLICKLAFEDNINIIVMGTHGKKGIRKNYIGSEAISVVKNASCPILTIPGRWQKTDFEKVLFPVRITSGTVVKYFYSRPIIEKNNSKIFLLGLTDQKYPGDVKEIATLMDKIKFHLQNDKVVFQSAICQSKDFPNETLKISKEYKVDLIILNINFEDGYKPYYLGPYAQQVLSHSQIPILNIKHT